MSQTPVALKPVTLEEWSTTTVEDYGDPAPADERLAAQLGAGKGMVDVEWLRNGAMRIRTNAWVGTIHFTRIEIRIVPKLVGEELGVLRMIEYCSSLQSLKRLDSVRTLSTGGGNLLDLICQLLNEECDALIRAGVLQDYVQREEALHVLRGRLRLREQLTRRFGQLDALECSYDEFEADILENQILGAGLSRAREMASHGEIRQRSARLGALFAEFCDSGWLDPALAKASLVYHRRNEHYRAAHEWAFLLLEASAIRELFDPGDQRVSVFLINMNRLFERFVTKLLTDAYSGGTVRVESQRKTASIIVDETSGKTYARIIPDIVLGTSAMPRNKLPVDAKYKLYTKGIAQEDIYQTFMYAIAYADAAGPTPASVIVYPGKTTGRSTDLSILREAQSRSARIFCVSLNVPELLVAVAEGRSNPSVRDASLSHIRAICNDCFRAA